MIWETRHHAVRGITLIMWLQTRKDMQGQQVVPESSSTQHQTVETSLSIFLMCWVVLRRPGSAVAQMTLEEVSQFGSVWRRLGYRPMELLGVIGTLGSEQEQEVEPLRMFPWRRNTLLFSVSWLLQAAFLSCGLLQWDTAFKPTGSSHDRSKPWGKISIFT